MPEIIDMRGQLPTRPGAYYYDRPLSGITGATVHYTASPATGTVESIAAYQVGPGAQENFPAIAYSLVVDGQGRVYLCHDLTTRCWHSGAVVGGIARNASHVGIVFIGNHSPTLPQVRGLAAAVCWAERELGRTLDVEGHRDPPYKTACPGPTWPAWKDTLLAFIEEFR